MFANGSSALSQLGGQMKAAGNKLAPSGGANAGAGLPSARKHKKLLKNTVDAYEQISAIDTAAHEARTSHLGDLTSKLAAEGHHNVHIMTGHGSVMAQSTPRGYTGPTAAGAGAGAEGPSGQSYHQGGYYNAHSAHLEIAAGSGAPARNHTQSPASIPLAAAKARPILALPAGSATIYDNLMTNQTSKPAEEAPRKPFVADAKGGVNRPGAKPVTLKTPEGPERTFVVGKQGPLHTRETTPGNETKPIAKKVALNAPYGGPDDGKTKKKKRAPKKDDN